jgi:hypothetical protein
VPRARASRRGGAPAPARLTRPRPRSPQARVVQSQRAGRTAPAPSQIPPPGPSRAVSWRRAPQTHWRGRPSASQAGSPPKPTLFHPCTPRATGATRCLRPSVRRRETSASRSAMYGRGPRKTPPRSVTHGVARGRVASRGGVRFSRKPGGRGRLPTRICQLLLLPLFCGAAATSASTSVSGGVKLQPGWCCWAYCRRVGRCWDRQWSR